MAKIDRQTKHQIIYLANILPIVFVETHEKHIYTKAELDEMGYVGAEDLGDGTYLYRYPVHIAQNHVRCMIKRWRAEGYKGLSDYVDGVMKLKDTAVPA